MTLSKAVIEMTQNIRKLASFFRILMIGGGLLLSTSYSSLAFQNQSEHDIVRALAWSPDGSMLAVGGIINGQVGVYLLRDHSIIAFFETSGNVGSIAWSPDDTKIAALVGGISDSIQIWDARSGEKLSTILQQGATSTHKIAWHPNGIDLAAARGYLNVWNTSSGTSIKTLQSTTLDLDDVQTFAWHPNGTQLFFVVADKAIRLWDVATNSIVHEQKSDAFIVSLVTSPDGTKLAVGGSDGTVQVWDLATYRTLYTVQVVPKTKDVVWYVEWSHDGKIIAAAGARYGITIWDANSGKLLDTIEKQAEGLLKAMALSRYGGRLAYSTDRYGAGSPALAQTIFNDYTEPILNGAVQITVLAPSPEKLHTIIQDCGVQPNVQQSLMPHIDANELQAFTDELSALSDKDISAGCKADLMAVVKALMAKVEH